MTMTTQARSARRVTQAIPMNIRPMNIRFKKPHLPAPHDPVAFAAVLEILG